MPLVSSPHQNRFQTVHLHLVCFLNLLFNIFRTCIVAIDNCTYDTIGTDSILLRANALSTPMSLHVHHYQNRPIAGNEKGIRFIRHTAFSRR